MDARRRLEFCLLKAYCKDVEVAEDRSANCALTAKSPTEFSAEKACEKHQQAYIDAMCGRGKGTFSLCTLSVCR